MPPLRDFRTLTQFAQEAVDTSGKSVGTRVYWKLYVIENLYRIIIHSILSSQLSKSWWDIATNPKIRNKAESCKKKYLSKPWHTTPGPHDIYYVDLYDLNEIIRANSHIFSPVIHDIDRWIVELELIRLPRNVVAHMNFPSKTDRQRIDILYEDLKMLINSIQCQSKVILQIP